MDPVQPISFLVGLSSVIFTMRSAIHTFVLPRSADDPLTRGVFVAMRRFFLLRTLRARSYEERDRVMALYAPASLLALPIAWLAIVLFGYTCMFWSLGVRPAEAAFTLSGSSLLTLGFAPVRDIPTTLAAISEAAVGLILIALLIAYLPTMYTAFARRETAVTLLEVRAGAPPSAIELIERAHRLHGLDTLAELWELWEVWFAEIEENHTSLAALVFFRSPQPDHSWVTAAGAVLDAASLVNSVVNTPHHVQADLCIRAGYLALRRIADLFRIPYSSNPEPDDVISISRQEFDAACARLAESGVPLTVNREKAWRDFAGWRVNYDAVLLGLAALTMAPYAPWSSDRSLRPQRTAVKGRKLIGRGARQDC